MQFFIELFHLYSFSIKIIFMTKQCKFSIKDFFSKCDQIRRKP